MNLDDIKKALETKGGPTLRDVLMALPKKDREKTVAVLTAFVASIFKDTACQKIAGPGTPADEVPGR
jgi:hypothetical protein